MLVRPRIVQRFAGFDEKHALLCLVVRNSAAGLQTDLSLLQGMFGGDDELTSFKTPKMFNEVGKLVRRK